MTGPFGDVLGILRGWIQAGPLLGYPSEATNVRAILPRPALVCDVVSLHARLILAAREDLILVQPRESLGVVHFTS